MTVMLEPREVLRAVTSRAAEACRVGDRKGRIAPGYDADLLAILANPLTEVDTVLRPVHVWHQGVLVR